MGEASWGVPAAQTQVPPDTRGPSSPADGELAPCTASPPGAAMEEQRPALGRGAEHSHPFPTVSHLADEVRGAALSCQERGRCPCDDSRPEGRVFFPISSPGQSSQASWCLMAPPGWSPMAGPPSRAPGTSANRGPGSVLPAVQAKRAVTRPAAHTCPRLPARTPPGASHRTPESTVWPGLRAVLRGADTQFNSLLSPPQNS